MYVDSQQRRASRSHLTGTYFDVGVKRSLPSATDWLAPVHLNGALANTYRASNK
jgi:hypothetical protein